MFYLLELNCMLWKGAAIMSGKIKRKMTFKCVASLNIRLWISPVLYILNNASETKSASCLNKL